MKGYTGQGEAVELVRQFKESVQRFFSMWFSAGSKPMLCYSLDELHGLGNIFSPTKKRWAAFQDSKSTVTGFDALSFTFTTVTPLKMAKIIQDANYEVQHYAEDSLCEEEMIQEEMGFLMCESTP